MPKETLREQLGGFELIVGWSQEHDYMQVAVDGGMDFDFRTDDTDDGPYTGLWYTFRSREEVDQFIKNLHKAKRKVFK